MQASIATMADPSRADRLEIAIQGKGAFRRFKDVFARWPDELERWLAYSAERQRGRARAWLSDAGAWASNCRREPAVLTELSGLGRPCTSLGISWVLLGTG
jgi:hypothetical protein